MGRFFVRLLVVDWQINLCGDNGGRRAPVRDGLPKAPDRIGREREKETTIEAS